MSTSTARRRYWQGGFSLPAAIFVIVVLALLGTMMVTIGTMQRATAAAAAQGARAYHAARTGIEWGIFQVAPSGSACFAPASFTLAVTGLNGFAVTVQCVQTQHRERGDTYGVFTVTSTATFGTFGDPDYVARTLQATVTNASAP
jgi:MSHA biogenesis protein MshP